MNKEVSHGEKSMTPNDILSYCQMNLKDVVLVESWGESGIFYMEHTWNTQGAETILYS